MTNLTQFAFQENQVRVLMLDNNPWFTAKDVALVLGYTEPARMLQLVDDEDKKVINPQKLDSIEMKKSFNSNAFKVSVINESGLKKLITKSTKANAIYLAKSLGIEVVYTRKQQEYIHILELAFEDLQPIKEFYIHGYRVDLYLATVRIAIECDEYSHNYYCEENELKREATIRNALGCSFIRFNPDARNFNIGKVIKQIRDLAANN